MEKLNIKIQKLIIWVCGYVGLIPLLLVGLYTYKYNEQEEVKNSVKKSGMFCFIFIVAEMIFLFFRYILFDIFSVNSSGVFSILVALVSIAQIVLFAVFGAIDIFSTKNKTSTPKVEVVDAKTGEKAE